LLTDCSIQGICSRLAQIYGNVEIFNNAPGCNSIEEVDSICNLQNIEGLESKALFTISPNPANDFIEITCKNCLAENLKIKVFNFLGQVIISEDIQLSEEKSVVNISGLPSGIYLLKVYFGQKEIVNKFLKR